MIHRFQADILSISSVQWEWKKSRRTRVSKPSLLTYDYLLSLPPMTRYSQKNQTKNFLSEIFPHADLMIRILAWKFQPNWMHRSRNTALPRIYCYVVYIPKISNFSENKIFQERRIRFGWNFQTNMQIIKAACGKNFRSKILSSIFLWISCHRW